VNDKETPKGKSGVLYNAYEGGGLERIFSFSLVVPFSPGTTSTVVIHDVSMSGNVIRGETAIAASPETHIHENLT
jgi:hypothetical protein